MPTSPIGFHWFTKHSPRCDYKGASEMPVLLLPKAHHLARNAMKDWWMLLR